MRILLTVTLSVVSSLVMTNCSKKSSSTTSPSSTTTQNGGNSGGSAPDMAATSWVGPCNDAGPLNSPVAYSKVTLDFTSSTDLDVDTVFYSDSCSTQTAEFVVAGTYTIGSSPTSSPSNGWPVQTTLNASNATTAEASGGSSTSAAEVINADCGGTVFSSNNNGANFSFPDLNDACSSDSRFSTKQDSSVANIVIVVNGTTLSTTAMDANFPGVTGSASSSTTLTFTKN